MISLLTLLIGISCGCVSSTGETVQQSVPYEEFLVSRFRITLQVAVATAGLALEYV